MNKKGIYYPLLIWGICALLLLLIAIYTINKDRQEAHDKAPEICEKIEFDFLKVERGLNDYVVCFNNETKDIQRFKIW